jgi:serine/threonine protein phosphatase PrpC
MTQAPFTFDTGTATHVGKVRTRNEDSHLARPDAGLWAVADGMGGHEAGDVASQLIVRSLDTIAAGRSATELLEETEHRISIANGEIIELSRKRGGAVIGSTVAVLLISEDHFACLWAGDSRLYLVRGNSIKQITRDHTELEDMLASGAVTAEEAEKWPNNVITRAVGVQDNPELDIVTGAIEDSDIFVLCSDGLTKHVADEEIQQCVTAHDAQASSAELVGLALQRGGLDNVTVMVVQLRRRESKRERTVPAAILRQHPAGNVWE